MKKVLLALTVLASVTSFAGEVTKLKLHSKFTSVLLPSKGQENQNHGTRLQILGYWSSESSTATSLASAMVVIAPVAVPSAHSDGYGVGALMADMRGQSAEASLASQNLVSIPTESDLAFRTSCIERLNSEITNELRDKVGVFTNLKLGYNSGQLEQLKTSLNYKFERKGKTKTFIGKHMGTQNGEVIELTFE